MKGVKITFMQHFFSYTRLNMSNCHLRFICSENSIETLKESVNFGQTK